MSWFMVDVETDGPIPGDYSMIEFGAVLINEELVAPETFHGFLHPISYKFDPEALKVSKHTREETLAFPSPEKTLTEFVEWVKKVNRGKRAKFISDNNGFDFMFMTWYLHHFLGSSIFGHSSTNLGSLFKGMVKDMFLNFKHLRVTKHTHNPVDDCMGNVEAFFHMRSQMGLKVGLE